MIYRGFVDIGRLRHFLRKTHYHAEKLKDVSVSTSSNESAVINCTDINDDSCYVVKPYDKVELGFHNKITVIKGPFEMSVSTHSRNLIGRHYVQKAFLSLNHLIIFGDDIHLNIGVKIYTEEGIYYVSFSHGGSSFTLKINHFIQRYLSMYNDDYPVIINFIIPELNSRHLNMNIIRIDKKTGKVLETYNSKIY